MTDLIDAIKANTEAVQRLTDAWNKLTARAIALEKAEGCHTVTAAGVPLAQIRPPAPPTVEGFTL